MVENRAYLRVSCVFLYFQDTDSISDESHSTFPLSAVHVSDLPLSVRRLPNVFTFALLSRCGDFVLLRGKNRLESYQRHV